MTLRHLKIFLAIYETGSTVAASRKLLIAQPSVSVALSEMEDYYGIRLFERYAKRLLVTDAGREIYQYARHVVDLFEEMEESARGMGTHQTLRIGSSITIGSSQLPRYVKMFQKTHPGLKIQVTVSNTKTVVEQLLCNELDLALVADTVHDPFLVEIPYETDHLVLICNPSHPFAQRENVSPEALTYENVLLREKGSAVRNVVDACMARRGLAIVPAWQSVSAQAILQAVKEDIGVSILPHDLVRDNVARGEVVEVPVEGIDFARKFNIIYHKNKFHFPAMDDFITLCQTSAK